MKSRYDLIKKLLSPNEPCHRCKKVNPSIYVLQAGERLCFICSTRKNYEKRNLIESMQDVIDWPPLYPYFFPHDAMNIDHIYERPVRLGWEQ